MIRRTKRQRLDLPTDKEISEEIRRYSTNNLETIDRALRTRGLATVFSVIDAVSTSDYSFRITDALVQKFHTELTLLGKRTALAYASSWISRLETVENKRNYALLLNFLVRSIDVLQNKELCLLLKTKMPAICKTLYSKGLFEIADVLLYTLFLVCAAELAYSDNVDTNGIDDIWNDLLDTQRSQHIPSLLLAAFLLKARIKKRCGFLIDLICDNQLFLGLEENSDDPFFCSRTQFFSLLADHLLTIVSQCSVSKAGILIDSLVGFSLVKNTLNSLLRYILHERRMFNDCGDYLILLFFHSTLSLFSKRSVIFGSQNKGALQIKKVFDKSVVELTSLISPDERHDDVQEKLMLKNEWKKVMKRFSEVLSKEMDCCCCCKVQEEFRDILLARNYSFAALPLSTRSVLFGIHLMLFALSRENYACSYLSSAIVIIESDEPFFHELLGCLDVRNFHSLLKLDFTSANGKSLLSGFWRHYLLSNNEISLFIKNCALLKSIKGRMLSEIFWFSVVVDVFCDLAFNTDEADKDLIKGFVTLLTECSVVETFSGSLGDDILHDFSSMKDFADMLKPLRQLELINKRIGSEKPVILEKSLVVHICKTICRNCKKYLPPEGENAQSVHILNEVVEFLLFENKFDKLIMWKYLVDMSQYSCVTIEKIFLSCSLKDLELLCETPPTDMPTVYILKCCLVIGRMRNNKKQGVLLKMLDFLIDAMCHTCAEEPEIVLTLARHLLPLTAGSDKERDFLSFVVSLLSTSFPVLYALKDAYPVEKDTRFFLEIEETLLDCLRLCPNSVVNDQCATYIQLLSCITRKIQYWGEQENVNIVLQRQLNHKLVKLAQAVSVHKAFARIVPFLISECLSNPKHCMLAIYKLLSVCDNYSIATLTSSLPPAPKQHFATLYPHYRKANAYVV